ncbi:MAG: tripartite tricarboxylate transporter substrate binding protein [Hyphomicrobiaceae bacterium]
MNRPFSLGLIAALAFVPSSPALAEWQPAGPITLNIGFKEGGGTDTQARLIGSELAKKLGWKFIYKNVVGKGGSKMARRMKGGPTDGLTIGMAVTTTFTFNPLLGKAIGYSADDFDFIISTAPTQTGLVVRKDSEWRTLKDVVTAAQNKKLKFGVATPRLGEAARLISKKYGVAFNYVKAKGGRGVLNSLMTKDVDLGFISGIHVRAVEAGNLINVASAEDARLRMSPQVPTLKELGIPYQFGVRFIAFAPKGIDQKARNAIAAAFKGVLADEKSKSRAYVDRAFGQPPLVTGNALAKQIADELANNKRVFAAIQ